MKNKDPLIDTKIVVNNIDMKKPNIKTVDINSPYSPSS